MSGRRKRSLKEKQTAALSKELDKPVLHVAVNEATTNTSKDLTNNTLHARKKTSRYKKLAEKNEEIMIENNINNTINQSPKYTSDFIIENPAPIKKKTNIIEEIDNHFNNARTNTASSQVSAFELLPPPSTEHNKSIDAIDEGEQHLSSKEGTDDEYLEPELSDPEFVVEEYGGEEEDDRGDNGEVSPSRNVVHSSPAHKDVYNDGYVQLNNNELSISEVTDFQDEEFVKEKPVGKKREKEEDIPEDEKLLHKKRKVEEEEGKRDALTIDDLLKVGALKLVYWTEKKNPNLKGFTLKCAKDPVWNSAFIKCEKKWKKQKLSVLEPETQLLIATAFIGFDVYIANKTNTPPPPPEDNKK